MSLSPSHKKEPTDVVDGSNESLWHADEEIHHSRLTWASRRPLWCCPSWRSRLRNPSLFFSALAGQLPSSKFPPPSHGVTWHGGDGWVARGRLILDHVLEQRHDSSKRFFTFFTSGFSFVLIFGSSELCLSIGNRNLRQKGFLSDFFLRSEIGT